MALARPCVSANVGRICWQDLFCAHLSEVLLCHCGALYTIT